MKKSLLNTVLRIANDKLRIHRELSCYPHYAFIVQNNKLIEWATNSNHIPPLHYGYHQHTDKTFRPKYHAEIWAYKKARGLLTDDDFEIINIRLTKSGQVRLSKPCKKCHHLLSILGCRKFYYSSDCGFLTLAGLQC